MSGRDGKGGKGGKCLEEIMLSAAARGWSGVPIWATDEQVAEVKRRHPGVFSPPLKPFGRQSGLGVTDAPSSSRRSAAADGLGSDAQADRLLWDARQGSQVNALRAEEEEDAETMVGEWQDFKEDEVEEEDEGPDEVLQQGMSVVSAVGAEQWHSERYNVREGLVKDMCFRLKVTPVVDAFADQGNHRFPLWWEDAFAEKWPQDQVIWANPPFSVMKKVVQKIKEDKAKVLLVCPDWRSCSWWQSVQEHVVRGHFYPRGTPVFELEEEGKKRKMEGIKWGLWAYYVDGAQCKEEMMEEHKEYGAAELEDVWQDTVSSRRRRRRKLQQQGSQ